MPERQAQIFAFLRSFQEEHGAPPSTRDIARKFKTSQPTALGHLHALARKGIIEKLGDGRFGIRTNSRLRHIDVPVFGCIPAGDPVAAEQQSDETIALDPSLFGFSAEQHRALWALRVSGDSMEGAGILDGDLAIMHKREPRTGDIVAALVDGNAATLKTLVKDKDRFILRAANERYKDIVAANLEVQGVLVGLVRTGGPQAHVPKVDQARTALGFL